MPRYRLTLEYDGRGMVGWQRQPEGTSIQALIEDAAAHLNGGAAVPSAAAGRTDAGVHAEAMVAQIDLDRHHPPGRVRDALNFYTRPHALAVLDCAIAPSGWHARFSAIERAYRYVILNRRPPPALELGRVWHMPMHLDAAAMHQAAQVLVGRHDFTSFRAASCQAKSPEKTMAEIAVTRDGDRIAVFLRARSFLHHQVRNIVGTLALVGQGRCGVADVAAILAAKDRARAGQTAPAEGLAFLWVRYEAASIGGGASQPALLPEGEGTLTGEACPKTVCPPSGRGTG
jgi:tRNA pseudouridine38-40 synthase